MLNDPQLDVDEAPKGAQYKVGDLVFTCDNEIMVVEDVQFIGSVYNCYGPEYENAFGYDEDDPKNYDYLLMTKESDEYWYSHAQIEHKANHMKEVYHG